MSGYAGEPAVAHEEQPDEHRGEDERRDPGRAGPGCQHRRTDLDHGSGGKQAHRLDAHLRQPRSARGACHGESRDRDDQDQHHAR